jgi:hypothetical protein
MLIRELKKQYIRVRDRRRYIDIFSKSIRNKNVIDKIYFSNNLHHTGRIIMSEGNLSSLKSCKKSGSWTQTYILSKKVCFWTSYNLNYFRKFPDLSDTRNFSAVIDKAEFIRLNNVTVNCNSIQGSLNIYDHYISNDFSINHLNEAVYLCVNGSDNFQHFVQDFLAILCQIKPFLNQNPQISLLINKPNIKFGNHDFFFEMLNINNPIVHIQDSNISVNKLYMLNFLPLNAIYSLPQEMYANLFDQISNVKNAKIIKQQYLVFFVREEDTRNISNIEQLRRELGRFAKLRDLNPVFINPSSIPIQDLIDILSNSKYIFGVHGGAMYNCIFASKESVIIEFITVESTDSLLSMFRGFGLNYFPYALNVSKSDKEFKISKHDINSIISCLDAFENTKS